MRRVLLLPTLVLATVMAPPTWGEPAGTHPPSTSSVSPAPLVTASPAALLAAIRAPGAAAVLVNVWATWCVPCREEMPDLLRLRRAYAERGLRVILVCGDFDSERAQAEAFLRELGVDFPTYFKVGDDTQFIDALDPAWTGALPATFIYDAKGERRYSLFGKTSYPMFEENVKSVLNEKVRR